LRGQPAWIAFLQRLRAISPHHALISRDGSLPRRRRSRCSSASTCKWLRNGSRASPGSRDIGISSLYQRETTLERRLSTEDPRIDALGKTLRKSSTQHIRGNPGMRRSSGYHPQAFRVSLVRRP
jgi:hypothetical protein